MVGPLIPVSSREGFYAINNQFHEIGPKRFVGYKRLENKAIYVRLDLLDVSKEAVRVWLHECKEAVNISGNAPKEHKHDSSEWSYGKYVGIFCDCCEISEFIYIMSDDGVLRLHLFTTKITPEPSFCIRN